MGRNYIKTTVISTLPLLLHMLTPPYVVFRCLTSAASVCRHHIIFPRSLLDTCYNYRPLYQLSIRVQPTTHCLDISHFWCRVCTTIDQSTVY